MTHLTELYANRTATGAPPSAIGWLREFLILLFSGFKGGRAYPSLSSLSGLSLLRELDLSDCYWWDAEIPDDFWGLYSLENLNLSGNHFTMVPRRITELSMLKVLVLGRCKRLEEIPEFPPSLEELDAHECASLQTSLASSRYVVEGTARMMSLHNTILERIQVSLSLSLSLSPSLMIFHGRTTLQRVSSAFSFLEMEFLNGLNIRKWDLH